MTNAVIVPEPVRGLFQRVLAAGELTVELRGELEEMSAAEQDIMLGLTALRLVTSIEYAQQTLDTYQGEARAERERQIQAADEIVGAQLELLDRRLHGTASAQ